MDKIGRQEGGRDWSTPSQLAKRGLRIPEQIDVASADKAEAGIAAVLSAYAEDMRNKLLKPYDLTTETATASDMRAINNTIASLGVATAGREVLFVDKRVADELLAGGQLQQREIAAGEGRMKATDPEVVKGSQRGKRSR